MSKGSAFLLMPFDSSLGGLHDLIVGAGDSIDIEVERADDIFNAGIVVDQIREKIRAADVVIAVCTGKNPNVFFELGIADHEHWAVLLAETKDDLPFDVRHHRAILYADLDEAELSHAIARAIEETIDRGKKDQSAGDTDVTDDLPRFERTRPAISGGESRFTPDWRIGLASGDYVRNIEWRFTGPRFCMEWRQAEGAQLEGTAITEEFDLSQSPCQESDLVALDQIGLEIRFYWGGQLRHELHRWSLTRIGTDESPTWRVGDEDLPPLEWADQ